MTTGVQTTVGQIVWHTLMTSDVEGAKDFYAGLLGWDYENFDAGGETVPMIKQHGAAHGGVRPAQGGVPSHWFAYVLVEDLDATVAKVEPAGGKVLVSPMAIPAVGRFSVFADPQGAVIAAFAPEGEMEPPAGTFVWEELLTTDIDEARRFYGAVFGWKAADMDMGSFTYTMFKRAGDADSAGAMQKPAEDPGPSRWLAYLATDDVDAAVERAQELGGVVHMGAMDVQTVGRLAVLGDPTGAAFGIFKPSA